MWFEKRKKENFWKIVLLRFSSSPCKGISFDISSQPNNSYFGKALCNHMYLVIYETDISIDKVHSYLSSKDWAMHCFEIRIDFRWKIVKLLSTQQIKKDTY